ncbi:NAD(P)H-binding protein [Simiduia sp. 21SJ11W-1]|uniref:NAD(P)H-binding protein n=1 Tax=Simiduia sp. 21SJ11W-1 TaxID=2909669 RepID=UPI00209E0AF6|nr:NAD(P)H-binding protein [Simiduia sp. 21SJ11W-1]UTA47092.1 NAD(P)H-binding protein [Simiduia sp. 21SJ11W-1]
MRLLILGATGAVGAELLHQALKQEQITLVIAPTRRPLQAHPKLMNPVVNFDALDPEADFWHVDIAICALGSTRKQAGSDDQFIRVDKGIPLEVAALVKKANATCFGLVSSLGARACKNLYLNTKAEAEQGVRALGFTRTVIARPSLIDTERTPKRTAESLGLRAAKLLGPLLPARLQPIKPATIARALLTQCLENTAGTVVLESGDLQAMGESPT